MTSISTVRMIVGVVRIEIAILLRRLKLRLHLIGGLSVKRVVVEVGLREVVKVRLIRRSGDALVCGLLHGQVVRMIEWRLLVRRLRYQVVSELILGHFQAAWASSGGPGRCLCCSVHEAHKQSRGVSSDRSVTERERSTQSTRESDEDEANAIRCFGFRLNRNVCVCR